MPYKEMEKHNPNFLEPPPDLIDGKEEWEVKQILNNRTYWCEKQYLAQWRGYAPAHDSWVDELELHAPNLLKDKFQCQAYGLATKTWGVSSSRTPHSSHCPTHITYSPLIYKNPFHSPTHHFYNNSLITSLSLLTT